MKLVALLCGFAMLCAFLELVNVSGAPMPARYDYERVMQLRTRRIFASLGLWFFGVIGLLILAIRACV